jgi:hypothetical protein
MRSNVGAISAVPPGYVNELTCRPNFMGAPMGWGAQRTRGPSRALAG